MLTNTDIPPGGEGKIEVTFDTSHRKGQQKKSITVESNDPRNPRAVLQVSATIEIVFGFEQNVLHLGKIRRGQPVTITTALLAKDPSIRETVTFTSSSACITASLTEARAASDSGISRMILVVTGTPDIPIGRINARLTARAGDASASEATIQVEGDVIGNVDVSQDAVQFHVDTSKSDFKPAPKVVNVAGTTDSAQFRLLGVVDSDQRLAITVDTVLAGKQYEITLTPQPAAIRARKGVSGTVTITTDDKEQPTVAVTYFLTFGN